MKYLLNTTEVYRFESENEVTKFLDEVKSNQGKYTLVKYSTVHKEKKSKGEIEDEWYRVTVVKSFNEEKEPMYQYDVNYIAPLTNNTSANE